MDVILYLGIITVGLIVYGIGYEMGIHSTGLRADSECDIFVQSKRTGYKYHASRYRLSPRGPEIYIYNWIPGEFVWHSVWHFESASQIVAYLMPDYAREHLKLTKMPNLKNNDFTTKTLQWHEKEPKNGSKNKK